MSQWELFIAIVILMGFAVLVYEIINGDNDGGEWR